MDIKRVWSST